MLVKGAPGGKAAAEPMETQFPDAYTCPLGSMY